MSATRHYIVDRIDLVSIIPLAVLLIAGCGGSNTVATRTEPVSYKNLTKDRQIVLQEARKWFGVSYRYGGSDRSGTDCSGFVWRMYEQVGVKLPRSAGEMYEVGIPVTMQQIVPGDLVFFRGTAGSGITHVGIYSGEMQFIHSSTSKGVISSTLEQEYYKRHYAGARKILR